MFEKAVRAVADRVGSGCPSWRWNPFPSIVWCSDTAIKLEIIGLGTLSLTVLSTNCHSYVLRGPVNAR